MGPDPQGAALVAVLLSGGGWAAKALTGRGAAAAALVGYAILRGAGWPGAAALGAFFILSSAIGRMSGARRDDGGDAKGERRDAWQVVANGGCAALGAVLAARHPPLALWVVTGGLASAAADTWATAIGARSRTAPRRLLVGRPVRAGSNGGMTWLGTAGAVAGAGVVSAAGGITGGVPLLVLWGTAIGTAGMALDSVLGATLQGRFHCPACGVDSEWSVHRCGTRTTRTGGLAWLTNDGVNAVTTAVGTLAGWLAWRCCAPS
jgi:uncharacterized protein (TIGR00297 family)